MRPEECPIRDAAHILFSPSYTPLDFGEHRFNLDFYRHASLMITLPSLHDETIAPPGESVVILHCLTTKESLEQLRFDKDNGQETYKIVKKQITDILIANAEKLLPRLSHKGEVQLTASHNTLERYTLNSGGATVGWTCHPQEAFNRSVTGL